MALYQTGTSISALVGIGTTNPYAKLDIFGGTFTTSNATTISHSAMSMGNGEFLTLEAFNSNNTSKLPISLAPYGGNVGIGVTNPQVRLSVVGNCSLGTGADTTTASYHTGMVNIIGGSTRALVRIENNNSVGSPGIIFGEGGGFTEDTQPTIKKVQGTNHLAIMCGGNVGIGSTSPGFKLDVSGGAIRGNGTFVGVSGTTNSTWAFNYIDTATTFKSILFGYANSGGNAGEIGFNYVSSGSGSNYLNIGFYGSRPLVVTYGGNVGIGITNPSYTLYASGNIATTSWFRVQSDNTGLYSDYRASGLTVNGSTYGVIDTYGSFRGGWDGYAMGNTVNIMRSGNSHGFHTIGIGWSFYNDGTTSYMAYSGSWKMQTISTGIWINATEVAMENYNSSASSKYIGVSGGGYSIGGMEIENQELVSTWRWSQKLHFRTHQYNVRNGRVLSITPEGRIGHWNENPNGYSTHEINSTNVGYGQNTTLAVSSTSGWIAASFGNNTGGDRVVIGTLNGIAHVGSHNAALNAWRNLSIAQGGSVGINRTDPGYTLDVSGTIRCTGDIIAYSDQRVKTDLEPIENALDKVNKITGYTFRRTDTKDTEKRHAGVIAQEVLEILPEVVYKDDNEKYNVAYGNLTALLIQALKEERRAREALEDRIKLLEQK